MTDDELTVLVALDSIKEIDDTLNPAVELAKARGGRVVALVPINVTEKTGVNWEEIYDTIKKSKAEPIIKKVKEACKKAGVSVSTKIKRGNPSRIISEVAKKEGADIVIVRPGSSGNVSDAEKTFELFGSAERDVSLAEEIDDSAIASSELGETKELLDVMNQNADALSELITKLLKVNELLNDSAPIVKGAFDRSLRGLDGMENRWSAEESLELAETFLSNTEAFTSLVKKMAAINELLEDYAPIMKGAFERSLVTLDRLDNTVNAEDATILLETVLKNTGAFSSLAGTAAGAHELVRDASPIFSQAFAKSLATLDTLQRNGALDRLLTLSRVMENVYNNISDEDLERLGTSIPIAIDIFNRAMSPEVTNVVTGALDTVETCQRQYQDEGPKRIGMFNYVSVMRDPDIQMAIGFLTNFLKNFNICIEGAQQAPRATKSVEETPSKTAAAIEAEE